MFHLKECPEGHSSGQGYRYGCRWIMVDFTKYSRIADYTFFKSMGKVENVVGLTIESAGPEAKLGDLCMVFPADKELPPIMSEVVGFKGRKTLLMPYEKTEYRMYGGKYRDSPFRTSERCAFGTGIGRPRQIRRNGRCGTDD